MSISDRINKNILIISKIKENISTEKCSDSLVRLRNLLKEVKARQVILIRKEILSGGPYR